MYECMNSTNLEIISLMADALTQLWWSEFKEQLGADREIVAYLGMASECLEQAANSMRKKQIKPLGIYEGDKEALDKIKSLVTPKKSGDKE